MFYALVFLYIFSEHHIVSFFSCRENNRCFLCSCSTFNNISYSWMYVFNLATTLLYVEVFGQITKVKIIMDTTSAQHFILSYEYMYIVTYKHTYTYWVNNDHIAPIAHWTGRIQNGTFFTLLNICFWHLKRTKNPVH